MTSISLKRALYRACHRGSKEADRLLGGFMEEHVSFFDERTLASCSDLFNADDADIFLWVEHPESAPSFVHRETLLLLRNYIHRQKYGERAKL